MMGASQEAIDHYTTTLHLSFIPSELSGESLGGARRGLPISADRNGVFQAGLLDHLPAWIRAVVP